MEKNHKKMEKEMKGMLKKEVEVQLGIFESSHLIYLLYSQIMINFTMHREKNGKVRERLF